MLTPIPTRAAVWWLIREAPAAIVGFVAGFVGAACDQRGGRWRRGR